MYLSARSAILALVAATALFSLPQEMLLRTTGDVQALTPSQAARAIPVKLTAQVSYVDKPKGTLFVQDRTGGVYVYLDRSRTDGDLTSGKIVEVTGISVPARFSAAISNADIHVVGAAPLPAAPRFNFDRMLGTREDAHWGELEGVVRSGEIRDGRLYLNVAAPDGTYLACLNAFPADWESRYVDARIVTRGVVAAIFNDQRQATGVRIFVESPAWLKVADPPAPDVWSIPLSPAAGVGQFHREGGGLGHRIRVRAAVLAVDPRGAVYISDGTGPLAVQSFKGCKVSPGDEIDVAGFPGTVDQHPGLADSICRRIGPALTPVPKSVRPDEIQPRVDPALTWGQGLQRASKYDMQYVEVEGKVLHTAEDSQSGIVIVEGSDREFSAILPGARSAGDIEPGSLVKVRGVAVIDFDQYRHARSFSLLLSGRSDIAIVAKPSFWSLKAALWGLACMASFCLCALFWVSSLRKQVKRKTLELSLANQTLTQLSTEDALTGLANRRRFDQILVTEFSRSRQSDTPLSLVIIDIDCFKALNDSLGHIRGDQCLAAVAQAIESVIDRNLHLAARYGGEEFALILPGASHSEAFAIAERARRAVREVCIPNPGVHGGHVTISAGVSTVMGPSDADSPATLIESADRALYEAKTGGRDRVAISAAIEALSLCALASLRDGRDARASLSN